MNKIKILIPVFLLSSIASAVYSFSLDEINTSLEGQYDIDLQADKIDYRFSKQEQIKKNKQGGYISSNKDDYIDSDDNLNLDTIQDPDVEDNSQQGESKEEYDSSIVPINYFEKRKEEIKDNIQRKNNAFKMEYYEDGAIKVRNNLQRYYNPDLNSVLVGGVPSTFGFGQDSISDSVPVDDIGIPTDTGPALPSNNCSVTCDCGQWYMKWGICKQLPPNAYRTSTGFGCNRGYEVQGDTCIAVQANEDIPISDSPFDGIRYRGIQPIEEDDDPFGVSVKEGFSTQYSSYDLGVNQSSYQSIDYNFLNGFSNETNQTSMYGTSLNCLPQSSTNPGNYYLHAGTIPCIIKTQSSIYDLPYIR